MISRRRFLQGSALLALGYGGASRAGWQPLAKLEGGLDIDQLQLTPITANEIPRIINVFLYGGPSELAGNLTNIAEISASSENAYPASFLLDPSDVNSSVTANGFWKAAGGEVMEKLVADGDMTIYRTMNRMKEDTKDHGTSILQNLLGNLDKSMPGIATNLAFLLEHQNPFGKAIDELVFPFVTFEGETAVFNQGGLDLPLVLRPISMNAQLENPYQRSNIAGATFLAPGGSIDLALDALADSTNGASRHQTLHEGFVRRADYAAQLSDVLSPEALAASIDGYNASLLLEEQIAYPSGSFGQLLRSAVGLALANPETVFISTGSGGLGGWDDHSNALEVYPPRMQELMESLQAAVRHLNAAHLAGVTHADKVIINVYGDFGRNVNLNGSMGWDHGNNQNLYTVGGRGIAGRSLGKIVGRTELIGTPGTNRLFTTPTADSYQFEPFALASMLYRYWGVQNPEVLTGEPAIDETQPGETLA